MSISELIARESRTRTVYEDLAETRRLYGRLLRAAKAWRKARIAVLAVGGPAKFAAASDDLSEVVRECEATP